MKYGFIKAGRIFKYLLILFTLGYWIFIVVDDWVFIEKYWTDRWDMYIEIWFRWFIVCLLAFTFYYWLLSLIIIFIYYKLIVQNQKTNLRPEQIIRRLVDFIPHICKTHRQFVCYVEFAEQKEWELALDSLVELADETEYVFPNDFWLGLADAADKMNLQDRAIYCRKQIK